MWRMLIPRRARISSMFVMPGPIPAEARLSPVSQGHRVFWCVEERGPFAPRGVSSRWFGEWMPWLRKCLFPRNNWEAGEKKDRLKQTDLGVVASEVHARPLGWSSQCCWVPDRQTGVLGNNRRRRPRPSLTADRPILPPGSAPLRGIGRATRARRLLGWKQLCVVSGNPQDHRGMPSEVPIFPCGRWDEFWRKALRQMIRSDLSAFEAKSLGTANRHDRES